MKEFSIHFKKMVDVQGKIFNMMIFNFKALNYNILFCFYLKEYFKILILFSIFWVSYKFEINIYELIYNFIYIKYPNVLVLTILNFIKSNIKIIILILILLFILLIFYIKKFNIIEALKFIWVFIYHRINFLINLWILLKILKIELNVFFEYNFLIMVIFIIYLIIFWVYLIYKKKPLEFKLLHFLNIPLISIIIWITLFIIDDLKFFKTKYILIELDLKYYETNIELI